MIFKRVKTILENGARPARSLGCSNIRLVDWARSFSSLTNTEKSNWALSHREVTRIAGCARSGFATLATRGWKNVYQENKKQFRQTLMGPLNTSPLYPGELLLRARLGSVLYPQSNVPPKEEK